MLKNKVKARRKASSKKTTKKSSKKPADEKSIISSSSGNEPKTDWRSIYVAAALSFVGSAQFSLYFSALFPYLQIVSFHFSSTILDTFFKHALSKIFQSF